MAEMMQNWIADLERQMQGIEFAEDLGGSGSMLSGAPSMSPNGRSNYFQWEPVITAALANGPMNRASLRMAVEPELPPEKRDVMHIASALNRMVKSGVLAKKGELYSVGKARSAGTTAQQEYWARMTPEQRAAEMRRRGMKRNPKAQKLHPRDPKHPEHEAWVEKMRKVNRAQWAKLTPAQRKRRAAALTASRRKAQEARA